MERNNRPQGRETHVSGTSSGVHRRGSGLGTGPVGSGSRPDGNSGSGNGSAQRQSGGSSGYHRAKGSGSWKSSLVILALLLIASFCTRLYGNNGTGEEAGSGGQGTTQAGTLPGGFSGSGSSGGTEANYDTVPGSREKYTRILGNGQDQVTMMVYLCGTDLESKYGMASSDLSEMAAASLNDKLRIIVYTGGCKSWKTSGISSSQNQIYEISGGRLVQLVNNDGSSSLTDPATLSRFIRYCAENYPANRYELILWDHGGGSVTGYGYDETHASSGSMSLSGIRQALDQGGVKFDFIGFDACLMATVENGLMLDSYADYMIASEETEPGIGWYYTDWVNAFAADPSMDTVSLGQRIADDFVRTCGTDCPGQSATLSVVDLAELKHTTPARLNAFAESLSSMIVQNNYGRISTARNDAREYARSSRIDQIDLADFAGGVGNAEGQALAEALVGAVKYNRTSADMRTGSHGLSVYFPYRDTGSVDSAVRTYNAIGMESSYSDCIRAFASLECCGQAASGGAWDILGTLMGASPAASAGNSSDLLLGLLGAFLSGDRSAVPGLNAENDGFLSGNLLDDSETARYIAAHSFDPASLEWTVNAAGEEVVSLPDEQWDLVMDIDLNLFYDDGEGFVDLGLDNVYSFTDDGDLLGDGIVTWLAVDGQPVAYYHTHDSEAADGSLLSYGVVPVLLNGDRAELLLQLEHGYGTVTGARYVYKNGETGTVAKSVAALGEGDRIDFVCDYYSYDGSYLDSYLLGEAVAWSQDWQIDNVVLEGPVSLTYRFSDLYQQHYWTRPLALDGSWPS